MLTGVFFEEEEKYQNSLMDKARKLKWEQWLKNEIWIEILRLLEDRTIYLKIGSIARLNNKIPDESVIYSWLAYLYSCSMASGVRRQTDIDYQCISLGRILYELAQDPKLISRVDYITDNGMDGSSRESRFRSNRLNLEFTEMAGDGNYLDPEIIADDLASIDRKKNKTIEKIVTYVDWFVAHHDRRQSTVPKIKMPIFSELHETIDHLHDLFRKYFSLVTGGYFDLFNENQKSNIEDAIDVFFNKCTKYNQR